MTICETCKKNEGSMVASVPGVPYSASYCIECMRNGAHPFWILRCQVETCGGVDEVAPGLFDFKTYYRNRYMTLRDALLRAYEDRYNELTAKVWYLLTYFNAEDFTFPDGNTWKQEDNPEKSKEDDTNVR